MTIRPRSRHKARRPMASPSPDQTDESMLPNPAALARAPAFFDFAHQMLGDSERADGLSPEQLARVAAIGEMRTYETGELIGDEHERGDELYIVEAGAVEVWLDPASIGDEA